MMGFGNTCHRIRRLLSDRVDAPLAAINEKRVAAHLALCPDCRDEFEFYAQVKGAAAAIENVAPPAYLWDRISMRLDEHPWGEDNQPAEAGRSLMSILRGNIGYAGAALSIVLLAVFTLVPAGSLRPRDRVLNSLNNRSLRSPSIEYLSLYMMTNGDRFPAEVREYYVRQAEGLNQQIQTIKTVLVKFPHNRQIMAQLAMAYEQKIRLYHQLGFSRMETRATAGSDEYIGAFDTEDRKYE